jgi:hypothetical protein
MDASQEKYGKKYEKFVPRWVSMYKQNAEAVQKSSSSYIFRSASFSNAASK